MRIAVGGLALVFSLLLSSCSKPETPPPPGPVALALPATGENHGVLSAQTVQVKTKTKGKTADYVADVALTPNWWVGGGSFKIVWYAGLSQTKRFFVVTPVTGAAGDQPDFLKNPEEGVREVKVSFDGGPPMSVTPTTARAPFKVPAGAKTVTQVEVSYGSNDAPQMLTWK